MTPTSGHDPRPHELRPHDLRPPAAVVYDQETSLPGQATVCPDLVVVPILDHGRYTGGFTLAHLPTGLYLPTPWGELTPGAARAAATQMAALDWSSPDRAVYNQPDDGPHRTLWRTAFRAAADYSRAAATDDPDDPDAPAGLPAPDETTLGGRRIWHGHDARTHTGWTVETTEENDIVLHERTGPRDTDVQTREVPHRLAAALGAASTDNEPAPEPGSGAAHGAHRTTS